MKKYFYLFIVSFSLMNCYTYKTIAEKKDVKTQSSNEAPVMPDNAAEEKMMAVSRAKLSAVQAQSLQKTKTGKSKENNANPIPSTIEEKLEANKYFKIEVGGRPYKIQVDKWENDTLVAHVIHHPKRQLKFHKNQINQQTIAERRFSQPTADIITVVAYAGIGLGIWALVK